MSKKNLSTLSASVIAFTFLAGSQSFAESSFQRTCSDVSVSTAGGVPTLQATCQDQTGSPTSKTSLVLIGIQNLNGNLVQQGGNSTYAQTCSDSKISVTPDKSKAVLSAACKTISGATQAASLSLDAIKNDNGKLAYESWAQWWAEGQSSFQRTCKNISFAIKDNAPVLQAECQDAAGAYKPASTLVLKGIQNINGNLSLGVLVSSFQKTCADSKVSVNAQQKVILSASCTTLSGSKNQASIPLDGIKNDNGKLAYER